MKRISARYAGARARANDFGKSANPGSPNEESESPQAVGNSKLIRKPTRGTSRQVRAHANDFAGFPPWAAAWLAKHAAQTKLKRVRCGARRRSDGKPCEALSMPGKRRCRWHGGSSTGPRTAEGKAKVSKNLPHS